MMPLALIALSLLAAVNADGYDKEKMLDVLQEAQRNGVAGDQHGRELWWWVTSKDLDVGARCGSRNTCAAGRECTPVALGNRCAPRTSCLSDGIEQFEMNFDVNQFKEDMLIEAGVTEREVIEAGEQSEGSTKILRNPAVRRFIEALSRNGDQFDEVGDIVNRCSTFDFVEEGIVVESTTSAPTISSVPTVAPSKQPTRAPSGAPSSSPTLMPRRTVYQGFSIEGGALMEGSLTVFWEKQSSKQFPPVYVKGCIGLGAVVGADLSLITIVAETNEPTQIQCLSTMYDVDIAVGLGGGYGIGVCMLSEPTFAYNEIKYGAGFSIGASAFSVCDAAQIAEGYGERNSGSYDGHGGGKNSKDY